MCFGCVLGITLLIVSLAAGGVRGQCNLEEARVCLANVTIPDLGTENIKEACQAYKTVDSCMAPYQDSCHQDPSYQEMVSGFSAIEVFCVGDENCDPTKCYKIIGIDITGASQPRQDSADKCTEFSEFKNCVDTQRPACEGNIMFTMLEEAYLQLETACTAGAGTVIDIKDCDIKGFASCMKEVGINLETPGNEYACELIDSLVTCTTKYELECSEHPAFAMVLPVIKKSEGTCQLACRIEGCLGGLDFPSDNCTNLQNSITCIEFKQSDCKDNLTLHETVNRIKALCSEVSQIKDQRTNRDCLSEAKINENCKNIIDRMHINASESAFCQTTAEYSMCAKMSVSNCDKEMEDFVSETATKLSSLKFMRKAAMNCPKSNGPSMSPTFWTTFVVFLLSGKLIYF